MATFDPRTVGETPNLASHPVETVVLNACIEAEQRIQSPDDTEPSDPIVVCRFGSQLRSTTPHLHNLDQVGVSVDKHLIPS